uniref:uncharacterized protein n=1 Tax=Myxine glutinosa TaxID=7769 RepID=UPI00358E66C7
MAPSLSVELDSFKNIIFFILHVSLAIAGTVLNLLIVLSILKTKQLLRKNRFLFIFNICFSNMFSGAMWFYVGLFDVKGVKNKDTYFIYPSLYGVAYLLVFMSQVDQFCAIRYPFQYVKKMTLTKTRAIIVFCWFWSFINVPLVNFLPNNLGMTILTVRAGLFNLVTFPLMIVFNISLLEMATDQARKTKNNNLKNSSSKHSLHLTIVVALSYIVLWFPTMFEFCKCVLLRHCLVFRNVAHNYLSILRYLTTITVPTISIAASPLVKAALSTLFRSKSSRNR